MPSRRGAVNQTVPRRRPRSEDRAIKVATRDFAKRTASFMTLPHKPNGSESCIPFMPNVMRVFLENGQTRSFKYDQNTTVQDVVESLKEKLLLGKMDHFSLALEHSLGPRSNRLSLLRRDELLSRIACRPGSQHFRCLLRLAFVPIDPIDLYKTDPVAFEYYYQQCVNDVVVGRFAYEMRYEACVRLAALHMQQVALDTKSCSHHGKLSLKDIEKEYGLGTFLPTILLENVKRKEIRKHLRFYLKRDVSRRSSVLPNCASSPSAHVCNNNANMSQQSSASSSISNLLLGMEPAVAVRLKYVQVLAHLPTFGGRSFCVTFKETRTDMLMQVHPKQGLLVRHPGRTNEPTISISFDLLEDLRVSVDTEVLKTITIRLKNNAHQALEFLLDKDDIDDLVLFIQGYHRLLLGFELPCAFDDQEFVEPPVPPYTGLHSVRPAGWNYSQETEMASGRSEQLIDLSRGPPAYQDVITSKKVQFSDEDSAAESTPRFESSFAPEDPLICKEKRRASVDVHHKDDSESPTVTIAELSETESVVSSICSDHRLPAPGAHPAVVQHPLKIVHEGFLQQRSRSSSDQWSASVDDNPKTFLRAKDSLLVKDKVRDVVCQPKTFLQAKDSIRLRHRSGSVPIRDKCKEERGAVEPLERRINVRLRESDRANHLPSMSEAEHSSSDTDSVSTPSESPIHRPSQLSAVNRKASPARHNASFGLKSPDALPCSVLSDAELQEIIASCGLEGQTLEELLLLFPDNFCPDTEIIDLTMLPSPAIERPIDATTRIDVASVTAVNPPTPFRDEDPKEQFATVMERLAKGDVRVIDDSHQKATQSCRKKKTLFVGADTTRQTKGRRCSEGEALGRNCKEFERFVAGITIPPPPSAADAAIVGDPRRKHVRFNPVTQRRFSEDFDHFRPEQLITTGASSGPKSILATSRTFPVSVLKQRRPSMDAEAVRDFLERSNSTTAESPASLLQHPFEVRRVSLKEFTGLEDSPLFKAETSRKDLKNSHGLAVLEKGTASIELKEEAHSKASERRRSSDDLTCERRRWFARIRSVDPTPGSASPEQSASPAKKTSVPPNQGVLKSIAENPNSTTTSPNDDAPHTAPVEKRPSLISAFSSRRAMSVDHNKPSMLGNGLGPFGEDMSCGPNGSAGGNLPLMDCATAKRSIGNLVQRLNEAVDNLPSRSPRRSVVIDNQQLKIRLLSESQQFAAASKILVRSATEQQVLEAHVAQCLAKAVRKSQAVYEASESLLKSSTSLFKAQLLAAKIKQVLCALDAVVDSLAATSGKQLAAPEMKTFMRQSTTLAATLTQLIQAVRDV
uniref:FERM and PDZ domain-containing protein 4 n=1 Tax=Plectus sambesii TaxID=2011161 RepID=A0A914VWB2_9BILA